MRYLNLLLLALCFALLCGVKGDFDESQFGLDKREGHYFALFFPVNDYQNSGYSDLDKPIKNAEDIARELREFYGFQTEILPNATAKEITDKISEYRKKYDDGVLPKNGQLFIFFSGHGEIEDGSGYFMGADGDKSDLYGTGVNYGVWRRKINNIACRHILVAIDACFSISFSEIFQPRGAKAGKINAFDLKEKIFRNHLATVSRHFLSSDSKEETTPDNSNFAKAILNGLKDRSHPDGFFTSSQLFSNHLENIQPSPHFSSFGDDEAASTFMFFHDSITAVIQPLAETELEAWATAERANNCTGYRNFLLKFPDAARAAEATAFVKGCEEEEKMIADWEATKELNNCEGYKTFWEKYPEGYYTGPAKDKWKELECSPKAIPGKMMYVGAGTYKMGELVAKSGFIPFPSHQVSVSSFYLSATELTNREYVEFLNDQGNQLQDGTNWYHLEGAYAKIQANGRRFKVVPGQEDFPVVNVSWFGAIAYCNWLSRKKNLKPVYKVSGSTVTPDWTANGYRLPTEAEWEYAARSRGLEQEWAGTNVEEEVANFCNLRGEEDGEKLLAKIAQFQANQLGLADMSGNVQEWCWDWYSDDYYKSSPTKNPRGPANGQVRVLRGGSWAQDKTTSKTTHRMGFRPSARSRIVGFRLARTWSRSLGGKKPQQAGGSTNSRGTD